MPANRVEGGDYVIKASELLIDNASFGASMLFAACSEYYDYNGGVRSAARSGYKYDVLLPAHGMERLTVKIPGEQRIPDTAPLTPVSFVGLRVRPYPMDKGIGLSATAENITIATQAEPAKKA